MECKVRDQRTARKSKGLRDIAQTGPAISSENILPAPDVTRPDANPLGQRIGSGITEPLLSARWSVHDLLKDCPYRTSPLRLTGGGPLDAMFEHLCRPAHRPTIG